MLLSLNILFEVLLLSLGAYLFWYLPWVLFILSPRKRQEAFHNVPHFDQIVSMVKGKRIASLLLNGVTIMIVLIIDGLTFLLTWVLGEAAFYFDDVSLVACLVPTLTIFVLFHIGFCFIFWKLWKKTNVGVIERKEAISKFLFFKQNWIGDQSLKKVKIKTVKVVRGIKVDLFEHQLVEEQINPELLTSREEALLFTKIPNVKYGQRHASFFIGERAVEILEKVYRWRLKKLAKKELSFEQYSWKLLRIFIAYLNKSANFVLIVQKSQYQPFVSVEGHPIFSLWELKAALINNFFSYEQEFKLNKKPND